MGSLEVKVDLDKLGLNDTLSPQITAAIQSSIQSSLAIIRDRWQTTAQNKLNSSRPLYLQGLKFDSVMYPYENNVFSGAVQLQGKFPNMLETGFSPFDIKIGFSKSNRRIKKKDGGGWYLTIPYRHSTPGSFMYGKSMPKGIYAQAKKLQGGALSFLGAGDISWKGYQRKNKTYDGLQRIVKSYQKATQSQYMTFRRVSDKSDPNSWWHPGYSGVKIAEGLMPFAQKTFIDFLTANLNGVT